MGSDCGEGHGVVFRPLGLRRYPPCPKWGRPNQCPHASKESTAGFRERIHHLCLNQEFTVGETTITAKPRYPLILGIRGK